ncbi:MAG TPA: malectin domain-containing carbohydrate-binding protein [Ktedonobacteraceae bacterium]
MLFDNIFSFASEGAKSGADIAPKLSDKIPGTGPSAKIVREESPEALAVLGFINTLTRATQQNASTQKTYANDPGSTAQAASSVMKESSGSLDDILEKTNRQPFPSSPNIYGINAGGSKPVPFRFEADKYAQGGGPFLYSNSIRTNGIINAAPQELYRNVRFGNFSYAFPYLVPNKPYLVRLHFAECTWSGKDQRLANIVINNQQVLSNFDIFEAAGGSNIACVKEFTTSADGRGQITIQFKSVKDNAIVSGIEILDV